MPSILEAGHAATIEEVKKENPATLRADIDTRGVEASVNTTKGKWTFTAYAKKLWRGAWSYGGRVERPLGFLSRGLKK